MNNEFSIAAHWPGDFDETGLQKWAEELRRRLHAPRVDLGLVFMTPRFFRHAKPVLEILQVHAQVPLLAGCSSQGLIAGGEELEENPGLAVGLYSLPGADLKAFHFTQEQVEEANGPGYWRLETGRFGGVTEFRDQARFGQRPRSNVRSDSGHAARLQGHEEGRRPGDCRLSQVGPRDQE